MDVREGQGMRRLIVIAVSLLALSLFAHASPVTMVFDGFQSGGWPVGYPYTATINGGSPSDVMCDDWVHGGLPGDTWQANFTNLGTGNLTELRFNLLPNALTLYKEAGWLLLQTEVTPHSQWMAINYAVWNVFDPNVPVPSPYWSYRAQQEALAGFPGVDFSQVGIYTPLNQYDPNPANPQEFLQIVPSVPEPGTLALLFTGLMGAVARKRWL
jgi:hypothetical protein